MASCGQGRFLAWPGLTASHVSDSRPTGPAVISLGLTKGGKRQGCAESVTLYGEDICRRLFQWCKTASPRDSLTGPSHIWRRQFADALKALQFDQWDFRPYSLRRGGATHQFRQHGVFDRLVVHGRWQAIRTARLYVNEGLAVLAELRLVWNPFSRNLRTQYHTSLTQKLPPLEPAPRSRTQRRGAWKDKKKHRKNRTLRRKGLDFLLSRLAGQRKCPCNTLAGNLLGFGRKVAGGILYSWPGALGWN